MMLGWIKLHRKIYDNPIFKKSELLHVWLWCLIKASHSGNRFIFNGDEYTVEPGQFISGRKVGADECGMTEIKFMRKAKILARLNMITLKPNNRFTLYTIVNWAEYQFTDQNCTTTEQQMNNKCTTTEQQVNTIKNVKNDNNEKNVAEVVPNMIYLAPVSLPATESPPAAAGEFLESYLMQTWGFKDGRPPSYIMQKMYALGVKFGYEKLFYAIEQAATYNKRNYAYVEAICNPEKQVENNARKNDTELQKLIAMTGGWK